MKHENFVEKISLWLDNELSPAEVEELKAHLAQCPACQHTYQAMRQVDQLFRNAATCMVNPSAEFKPRLQAGLTHYRPANFWQTGVGLGALLLGAVLLLIVGGTTAGLTLTSTIAPFFSLDLVHRGLLALTGLFNVLNDLMSVGSFIVKFGLITIRQPLFWGYVIVALSLTWLWIRMMRMAYRRMPVAVEVLTFNC